ncbi:MAG: DEAD/DEAH box helicase [Pseudomonadota bacterium]
MTPSNPKTGSTAPLATLMDEAVGPGNGLGAKRIEALATVFGKPPTTRDLLLWEPTALDDFTAVAGPSLIPGAAAALWFRPTGSPRQVGRRAWRLDGTTDGRSVTLLWFRRPPAPLTERLATPGPHLLHGRLREDGTAGVLVDHPRLLPTALEGTAGARYRGIPAAHCRAVGNRIRALLAGWPDHDEPVSATQLGLPTLPAALALLHGLVPGQRELARRRLALDEWAALRLDLAAARAARGRPARPIELNGRLARALAARLPFSATTSQEAAHQAIRSDLESGRRMTRLVNGDVGSGKTLVAALAIADVIEAGRQAALVAPSETLARQHAATLDGWLRPLGVDVVLLTGAVGDTARRPMLAALARGSAHVVVGTHAVLEPGVAFADLALVVVDEQQRFGVRQRLTLTAKGPDVHVLTLTATPIPRSLALALQGDVDVVRLDPRPGMGANVTTRAIGIDREAAVVDRLVTAVEQGTRAFWVCPSIDGIRNEPGANDRHRQLRQRLPGRCTLVTGRQRAAEQAAALDAFVAGDGGLLVATTVIEVGIDVPDATIMVIEGAERFGLAQLHQLRGRVGRAGQPASCVLLHGTPLAADGRRRLDVLRRCHDGMVLAETDLAWRGPGDSLGLRQSGATGFRFVDLATDAAWLAEIDPSAEAYDPRWLFPAQPTGTGGLVAG